MTLVIAELHNSPEREDRIDDPVIVGVSIGEDVEFDAVGEGEEEPVVDAVDEYSLEGH